MTDKEEESVQQQILQQVEFYFGDENLPKDRFLFLATQKRDGWVPISVIASFARMRQFNQPLEEIASALKKSPSLLQVNDEESMVRRKIPLVEPSKDDKHNAFMRSVYAKGFGQEQEKEKEKDDDKTVAPLPTANPTQIAIEKFFRQFGDIKQVRMRRDDEKKFKSSVFVEFADQKSADDFIKLANNDNPDLRPRFLPNTELLVMSKKAYVDMKSAQGKFSNQNHQPQQHQKRRRGFDAFKQVKQQKANSKSKSKSKSTTVNGNNDNTNKRSLENTTPKPDDNNEEQPAKKAKTDDDK